jgi:hypothetical protein
VVGLQENVNDYGRIDLLRSTGALHVVLIQVIIIDTQE